MIAAPQRSTPARGLDLPLAGGCRVLRAAERTPQDGALELVHAMLAVAVDRSALSNELQLAAHTERERLHLGRARANVLRALDLPAGAAVLELGAGCGALTRYLGETVALVDALEPDPADAAAARARTADLGNVEVFVGAVTDLPDTPAYDVAVAVGAEPSVDWLRVIGRRLLPGGVLVLAATNPLGVLDLAGPGDARPAGTMDPDEPGRNELGRRELERRLAAAGLPARTVLGAFPDHVATRVVLAGRLADELPELAVALPGMRGGREAELWRRVVAGTEAVTHANSLLILASSEPAERLWPADRLARYFNTDRGAALCGRAEVATDGTGAPVVRRAPLAGGSAGPVRLRSYTEPVYAGRTLLDVVAERPADAVELLAGWQRLLRERWAELGPAAWDLVPHNVIADEHRLLPIDLEWEVDGVTPDAVLGRGLLLAADELARRGWAGAGPSTTVYELAGWLTVACGHELRVLDEAITREAWFQAVCATADEADSGLPRVEREMREAWAARLAQHVEEKTDAGH